MRKRAGDVRGSVKVDGVLNLLVCHTESLIGISEPREGVDDLWASSSVLSERELERGRSGARGGRRTFCCSGIMYMAAGERNGGRTE